MSLLSQFIGGTTGGSGDGFYEHTATVYGKTNLNEMVSIDSSNRAYYPSMDRQADTYDTIKGLTDNFSCIFQSTPFQKLSTGNYLFASVEDTTNYFKLRVLDGTDFSVLGTFTSSSTQITNYSSFEVKELGVSGSTMSLVIRTQNAGNNRAVVVPMYYDTSTHAFTVGSAVELSTTVTVGTAVIGKFSPTRFAVIGAYATSNGNNSHALCSFSDVGGTPTIGILQEALLLNTTNAAWPYQDGSNIRELSGTEIVYTCGNFVGKLTYTSGTESIAATAYTGVINYGYKGRVIWLSDTELFSIYYYSSGDFYGSYATLDHGTSTVTSQYNQVIGTKIDLNLDEDQMGDLHYSYVNYGFHTIKNYEYFSGDDELYIWMGYTGNTSGESRPSMLKISNVKNSSTIALENLYATNRYLGIYPFYGKAVYLEVSNDKREVLMVPGSFGVNSAVNADTDYVDIQRMYTTPLLSEINGDTPATVTKTGIAYTTAEKTTIPPASQTLMVRNGTTDHSFTSSTSSVLVIGDYAYLPDDAGMSFLPKSEGDNSLVTSTINSGSYTDMVLVQGRGIAASFMFRAAYSGFAYFDIIIDGVSVFGKKLLSQFVGNNTNYQIDISVPFDSSLRIRMYNTYTASQSCYCSVAYYFTD